MTNSHAEYRAPEAPMATGRTLTDTMLAHLNGAAPWLRFLGVLGIVYSGLIFLGGLSFVFLMEGVLEGLLGFGLAEMFLAAGVWFGLFYAATGLCVLLPSLFALRFGGKIRSYSKTGRDRDLEIAFKNNKSLWKFCGILCIVGLALGILAIFHGTLVVRVLGSEGFL
ncbi:MAG: hypothetical protein FWB79_00585 [Treponema sp.]|nr:hypothetical protein [Treponema sp.]